MKAPAFSYLRPRQLHEVLKLLAEHGDEARLLAGGQTLLATLNMRLSEPALLIDMQAVSELKGLSIAGQTLRIGAMVTHTEIETSDLVAQHAPLLTAAASHIAHRAIRNMGTFGGSIAYGDPAAEWPACLLALSGVIVVRSLRGERRIAADDFFTGLYTTDLAPDEVIVACEIPVAQANQKMSFTELARRHGDYAVVGLAATATMLGNKMSNVRLAWIGVGSTPMRSPQAEQALNDQPLNAQSVAQAVEVLRSEIAPLPDLTHSEPAKRQLAGVLLKRALASWMSTVENA
ncbi:MAG: xanthine dehydrogenase family protein subunit M [Vitreoscilla sp.]|nr:xanthine dehydrogenase family protein subunit M [Polaromonas sp.]